MKKTFDWFKQHQIQYQFFDFKQQLLSQQNFELISKQVPLTELINQRGTTFKKLSHKEQVAIFEIPTSLDILNQNLSVIKRPLIQINKQFVCGFKPELWFTLLTP